MTQAQNDRRGRQGGLTLIETVLVLAILSALVSIVVQLALRARELSQYTPLLNRANEVNQGILQRLRSDLMSSVKLFWNDPLGTAYLGILDMTDAIPAINSTLPTPDPGAGADPEGLANSVLFARHVWTDEYECRSGNRYTPDVYRLVRGYLIEVHSESGNPGLDFCRWVSEPMVDGNQVDDIGDAADRAEVLDHLLRGTPGIHGRVRPRVEVVWRPGGNPAAPGTLRQIGRGGFLSSAPLPSRGPQWRILRDAARSSDGLLHGQNFAVARDLRDAARGAERAERLRDGFAVQITGPSGARRVLVELVVRARRGRLSVDSALRIAVNTRDL